jgi:hypothetical protein
LPGVERHHNAYTVRMVLRDIFDHISSRTPNRRAHIPSNPKPNEYVATVQGGRFTANCRNPVTTNARNQSWDCAPMIWL